MALGLLYLGQGDQVEDVLETISAVDHSTTSAIEVLVNVCAYTGTGDVLLIQDLLHRLTPKNKTTEEDEDEDEEEEEGEAQAKEEPTESVKAEEVEDKMDVDETHSDKEEATVKKAEEEEKDEAEDEKGYAQVDELTYAVLGIAMIAMGEEIGKEMSLRHFSHLMHYGNEHIRKTVPLAIGLLSASDPQMKIFDTLSRFSHDPDLDVSMNSIFAMGLVGSGTNNARLAQLLRQLAGYYSREQNALFVTRLSQGLVHLGKGTMTFDVFNDAGGLNKVTMASLLTVLVGMVTPTFMLEHHYLFYYLNSGVRPKYILTLNEEGEPLKVNVRVGQAVDTVGQAGKPKTITGWITHSTPVLLGHGERAELETNEYISYALSLIHI